jgi:hypothetical protein
MYVPAAAGFLILDWFLLWARFYWFGFDGLTKTIYTVVNFPWSIFYFWIAAKRNPWWHSTFGGRFEALLNDEFGPLLVFLVIALLQAAIFSALFAGFKKLRTV